MRKKLSEVQIKELLPMMNEARLKKGLSFVKYVPPAIVQKAESVEVQGDVCNNNDCGSSRLMRTGTCHVCLDCGESQGCS